MSVHAEIAAAKSAVYAGQKKGSLTKKEGGDRQRIK